MKCLCRDAVCSTGADDEYDLPRTCFLIVPWLTHFEILIRRGDTPPLDKVGVGLDRCIYTFPYFEASFGFEGNETTKAIGAHIGH
jgi:hypothetical protein